MANPKKALIFDEAVENADGTTNDMVAIPWSSECEGERGITLEFWPRDRAGSVQVLISLDDLRSLLELVEQAQ